LVLFDIDGINGMCLDDGIQRRAVPGNNDPCAASRVSFKDIQTLFHINVFTLGFWFSWLRLDPRITLAMMFDLVCLL
jgi:hypothetical protein